MKASVHWSGTGARVYRPPTTSDGGTFGVISGERVTVFEDFDDVVDGSCMVWLFPRGNKDWAGLANTLAPKKRGAKISACMIKTQRRTEALTMGR